jgi:hypothetical protein
MVLPSRWRIYQARVATVLVVVLMVFFVSMMFAVDPVLVVDRPSPK